VVADSKSVTLSNGFFASAYYEAMYALSAVPMALGFSMRVGGGRHVPASGPALLIANHQSFFDPLLVGLGAGRPLCYLARKTLYRNPVFAWLIRSLNAVPIDQAGIGKEGLKTTLELLHSGRAVLVFPEGERTTDGAMQALKPGVQLLIKRAEAPVVPVGIAGAYDAWPRWRKCPVPAPLFMAPRPGTIAVSYGRPLDSRRLAELPRQDLLERLFTEVHTLVDRAERLRRK